MTSTGRRGVVEGRTAIAALFPNRDAAERAIRELKAAGLSGDQIGVMSVWGLASRSRCPTRRPNP